MQPSDLDRDGSELIASLGKDPVAALGEIFSEHRDALKKLISSRLMKQVRPRLDTSDVLQDTMVEATRRVNQYLANPDVPFVRWVMFLADQSVKVAYRKHVATSKRSLARENPIYGAMRDELLDSVSKPQTDQLDRVIRLEERERFLAALKTLTRDEQELIRLRYFEGKRIAEIASLLGISEHAASKRALRCIEKLSEKLK